MKIRVIGSADMNSIYMSASYLIDGSVLVDIPGGALRELKRAGIESEEVKHVLITHLHGDHTLDLPLWILKKTKQKPEIGDKGIPIHAPAESCEKLKHLVMDSFSTSLTAEKMEKYVDWKTEDEFTIEAAQAEQLKVTRIPVRHGSLPDCCGYIISDGRTTVGFTGDSCLCDGVKELAATCDILFSDCDLIEGNEKHMGIDTLRQLRNEFPGCSFIATHLKDETRGQFAKLGDIGIGLARDGMLIDTDK